MDDVCKRNGRNKYKQSEVLIIFVKNSVYSTHSIRSFWLIRCIDEHRCSRVYNKIEENLWNVRGMCEWLCKEDFIGGNPNCHVVNIDRQWGGWMICTHINMPRTITIAIHICYVNGCAWENDEFIAMFNYIPPRQHTNSPIFQCGLPLTTSVRQWIQLSH